MALNSKTISYRKLKNAKACRDGLSNFEEVYGRIFDCLGENARNIFIENSSKFGLFELDFIAKLYLGKRKHKVYTNSVSNDLVEYYKLIDRNYKTYGSNECKYPLTVDYMYIQIMKKASGVFFDLYVGV